MNIQRFDVGILDGDHVNPMHLIIHQRTSTWWTHCVTFKDEQGNIWDPRMKGVGDGNISEYKGRRLVVLRYLYLAPYSFSAFDRWLAETLPKCEGYDYKALVGFLLGAESFQCDNRFYCSELPYRMYQDTGHKITREVKPFFYPADFYYSDKFQVVYDGDAGEVR
jgi:hypothetical protein